LRHSSRRIYSRDFFTSQAIAKFFRGKKSIPKSCSADVIQGNFMGKTQISRQCSSEANRRHTVSQHLLARI